MGTERAREVKKSSGKEQVGVRRHGGSSSRRPRSFSNMQDMIGNKGVNHLVQRSHSISRANDPMERQADDVANFAELSGNYVDSFIQSPLDEHAGLLKPLVPRRDDADRLPILVNKVLRSPGQPLDWAVQPGIEKALGYDLRGVRLHYGHDAARAARSVKARAFTFRQSIVFGAGQYAPSTEQGQRLLAHELTHVAQQSNSSLAQIQRFDDEVATEEPLASGEPTEGSESPSEESAAEGESYSLADLQREHPDIVRELSGLSDGYRALIRELDPILADAGIYDLPEIAANNAQQRRARRRVFAYEESIRVNDLFDASHLSAMADYWSVALRRLAPPLSALREMGGERASDAAYFEQLRRNQLDYVREFAAREFIRSGGEQREREEQAAREQTSIDQALGWIRGYARRYWREGLTRAETQLHGAQVARTLVHNMGLDADQIRSVFDTLGGQSPSLLNATLFSGSTVQVLLAMGISGLQEYYASGEGLLSGIIRGERESLLAEAPEEGEFSVPQRLIAVGGFIVGALQGIGESIVSNIKGIVSLFTPSFWRGMVQFIRDFLPQYIQDERFRFRLGLMIGQFSAREIRELASATPFEYGRTIGRVFGFALTEIVLTFVGLGFVLKALRGTSLLGRFPRLVGFARTIGQSAIVARGISVAQTVAEAIGALSRRVRLLRNRLPALTSTGRMQRAVSDLSDVERDLQRALRAVDDLEESARRALAEGNEVLARRHIDELAEATEDLERRIASYERQMGRPAETPAGEAVETARSRFQPSDLAHELIEEAAILRRRVRDPEGIRPVTDRRYAREYDVEVSIRTSAGERHTYRRQREARRWCRFSNGPSVCTNELNDINVPADTAAIRGLEERMAASPQPWIITPGMPSYPQNLYRVLEDVSPEAVRIISGSGGVLSPAGVERAASALRHGAAPGEAFFQGVRGVEEIISNPSAYQRFIRQIAEYHLAPTGTEYAFRRALAEAFFPERRLVTSGFGGPRAQETAVMRMGRRAEEASAAWQRFRRGRRVRQPEGEIRLREPGEFTVIEMPTAGRPLISGRRLPAVERSYLELVSSLRSRRYVIDPNDVGTVLDLARNVFPTWQRFGGRSIWALRTQMYEYLVVGALSRARIIRHLFAP